MTPLHNGFGAPGGGDYLPQYRLNADRSMVEVIGTISVPAANPNARRFSRSRPVTGRCGRVSWPVAPNFGAPSGATSFPRTFMDASGGLSLVGLQTAHAARRQPAAIRLIRGA